MDIKIENEKLKKKVVYYIYLGQQLISMKSLKEKKSSEELL